MNKEECLRVFAEMSPEDQKMVRAELLSKGDPQETGHACCCTDAMKQQLCGMMEKMQASENPMAMCEEMMQMCCEKMKEKCCQ